MIQHWRNGSTLAALPPPLRPADRVEGYLIQAQIERLTTKPLFGWKIAATSRAGQQHIAVDGPLAGRLLSEMVHPDGATIHLGANRMRCGANVLGDPRFALVWLANELSRHDLTLAANQIVTTGTCLVPLEIGEGDEVSMDYGMLGRVRMQFA